MDEIMKNSGIVRQLDTLGRIVLPIEMRRSLDLKEKDGVEITIDGDQIILRKAMVKCVFCGSTESIRAFHGKMICDKCAQEIAEL